MEGQEKLIYGWDATNSEWVKLQVDASGYVKVDMSLIDLNDLADVNAGSPSDNDALTWDAATSKWIPEAAVGGSTVVWKAASEQAYYATSPSAFNWTDLDLTAYTSSSAKIAILELAIHVNNTGSAGEILFGVRKNGTTPGSYPAIKVYNTEPNNSLRNLIVIVGMDTGQVIERYLVLGTGASLHTIQANVLGYVE